MNEKLRERFIKTYVAQIQTTDDIETLAKKIGISKNSLRRFLGKIESNGQMRLSTLNLIAKSIGYNDFEDFCDTDDFSLSDNIRILRYFL